jgi:hypothetical protein
MVRSGPRRILGLFDFPGDVIGDGDIGYGRDEGEGWDDGLEAGGEVGGFSGGPSNQRVASWFTLDHLLSLADASLFQTRKNWCETRDPAGYATKRRPCVCYMH